MSNDSSVIELDSLLGLRSAKSAVRRLIQSDCAAHAVLLYGAAGSGKRALARLLAQSWLCLTPHAEGACGECRACLAWDRGKSMDVLTVEPRGASALIRLPAIQPVPRRSKEDEELFPISEFLRTPPVAAARKVILIHFPERLVPAAANALLKTLEEPPEFAKFVLTSVQIGAVVPTIVSRCISVSCETPGVEAISSAFPDAEPWELVLSQGAIGELARVQRARESYRRLFELSERIAKLPRDAALWASDELRAIASGIGDATGLSPRASNAEALRSLALLLRARQASPQVVGAIVASHRRVVGNAQANLSFDAMFLSIMGDSSKY